MQAGIGGGKVHVASGSTVSPAPGRNFTEIRAPSVTPAAGYSSSYSLIYSRGPNNPSKPMMIR